MSGGRYRRLVQDACLAPWRSRAANRRASPREPIWDRQAARSAARVLTGQRERLSRSVMWERLPTETKPVLEQPSRSRKYHQPLQP